MPPHQDTDPRARRRWSRRRVLLGAVVALAIALRVALPYVARAVLERQGTAALAGTLSVGDVDVSLLRGGVALEDVALRSDETSPDDPPLVEWERLWVNIGWLALARKTIVIEHLELEGLRIHVDRLTDGGLILPELRAGDPGPDDEASPPVEGDPALAEEGEALAPDDGWAVVIERLDFHHGAVRLDDHVIDPPETREIALPSMSLVDLRLQPDQDARPGRARVRLQLDDGLVELHVRVHPVANGFDVTLQTEITNLPLDGVHVHLPQLGWSASRGRLSGLIKLRLAPGGELVARGDAALTDVAINVPGVDEPAVSWRSLEVMAERIDLSKKEVQLARVSLDGGRVLVRPRTPSPLPVLGGLGASPEIESDGTMEASVEAVPAIDAPVSDAEPSPPWSWRVAAVKVTDTRATIALEPPPLVVTLDALEVAHLSSWPSEEAMLDAKVSVAGGTVVVHGQIVLDPPGGELSVGIDGLDVGRLVSATGVAPFPLEATLGAKLDVTAREDPLVVAGTISLDDVETKLADGEEFLVGWEQLAVAIEEGRIAGLLPVGASDGIGEVAMTLGRVDLRRPHVVVTRTSDGLVLPAASRAKGGSGASEPSAPSAPTIEVTIGEFALHDGDVRFTDTAVMPTYDGHLTNVTVDATGVRVPENALDAVSLRLKMDGAPIEVTSEKQGGRTIVTSSMREIALAPFNPYVSPLGYTIHAGALTLDSTTTWSAGAYDSDNSIDLDDLVVGGVGGSGRFHEHFGVSLSVALALLRDMSGRISLGIPVEGDREGGAHIAVATIVREALTRAIVGALVSPLKLLGAVSLGGGGERIAAFEPAPVAFAPGTTVIAPEATAQADQLARALGQLPHVRLAVAGEVGPTDVRGLAEFDVLADLEASSGFVGSVRNAFSGGVRAEVFEALRSRAEGEAGSLDGGAAEQLDAWVAEKSVDDARLLALADQRAATLQSVLAEDGATAEQIGIDESVVDHDSGLSQVLVRVAADAPEGPPPGAASPSAGD